MQVWKAFGSRDQALDAPARLTRRVRMIIAARNEYDAELEEKQQREIEDQRREMERNKQRYGH